MKIHFTTKFSDNRQVFEVGNHYEVDNDEAMRLINAGVARKSPEPLPLQPGLPAPEQPSLLKDGEKIGEAVNDKLPDAKPVDVEKAEPGKVVAPAKKNVPAV